MSTVLRDAFSVTRFSFWTGVVLSCIVGTMAYLVTARSIESDAYARFLNHTKYAQNVIAVRIKSYTDLLRSTASMIHSNDKLTHDDFHEYVRGLDLAHNFPAVGYVNYAVKVDASERPAVIQQMRDYVREVFDAHADVDITPRGIRPSYLVVAYVEPHPPRPDMYGVDLLANPYFGSQLIDERDRGILLSSGTPIPGLSHPNDLYLGMRMPVYRMNLPTATVAQRRTAYLGSIGVAFSITRLLYGVNDEIPIPNVRMTLYDVGAHIRLGGHDPVVQALSLYDTHGTSALPYPPLASGDDVFSVTLPLDFNGRPWTTLYSVSKSALYTDFDVWYPKLMMVFGFLGAMLLYTLLHTLTSSRRAALELAREMTSELRESQNKLQQSHLKLRRLADHAYQIKELERKRIAREIHDDLGQNLLALRIEAEMLATRTHRRHNLLHGRARATLHQIDVTIKSVRQIINDLRPNVLDLGLSAAVEWQVNQFQRRTGIACEVNDHHGEIPLPDHCSTAFFRILQESLTNIVRHANATKVVIDLRLNGGWLSLTVRDNGCGLPQDGGDKFDSFGLVGIEERIVILGGTCAVFSEPGGGTTVMVSAPVIDPPKHLIPQREHSTGSSVI